MTDIVFSPCPGPHGETQGPDGAELVHLRPALFVLRGMYFNPVTGDDQPLPPHRWVLFQSETVFLEGTTSDNDGYSTIFGGDISAATPDDPWDLLLIPFLDDQTDSNDYATRKLAFIDVDKKEWASAAKAMESPELFSGISTRRLLGFPLWSTKRKAAQGGGFHASHPTSADYETKGTIATSEIVAFGSRSSPWLVQLDEGWLRSYVRFVFRDPFAGKERTAPQGLFVGASRTFGAADDGVSSVRLPNGAMYVVNFGVEKDFGGRNFNLRNYKSAQIEYADDVIELSDDASLARLEEYYFLPTEWSSKGMEAWEGAGDSKGDVRKAFADVATKGQSSDSPLSFHLDDIVLTGADDKLIAIDAAKPRLAFYTNVLELRDPKQSSHGKPLPYSKAELKAFPLRAEDATFQRDKGVVGHTRIVEHEGELYELSTAHARGIAGLDPCVGARAAKLATPIPQSISDTRFRLYVVDTRYVKQGHDGKTGKLAHLVIYVNAFVSMNTLKPENQDAAEVVEELLVDASKQWDQLHPGIPGSTGKDYVILSGAGAQKDSTFIKVRHIFGSRSADDGKIITIEVRGQGRATGAEHMILYAVYSDVIEAPPALTYPAVVAANYDFVPRASQGSDIVDATSARSFTMAHELGHSSGLPDEYIEGLATTTYLTTPLTRKVPRFDQPGRPSLPYTGDPLSFMIQEQLPRIRYLYDHIESLNAWASRQLLDHWGTQEGPFVAEYIAGAMRMTYSIPQIADMPNLPRRPWNGLQDTLGVSPLSLNALGVDESSVGPMFGSTSVLTSRFDGVLVVHPLFWFTFPANGNLDVQFAVISKLNGQFYGAVGAQRQPKIAVQTPGAQRFKSVPVLVHPRFEFGPKPSILTAAKPTATPPVAQVLQQIGDATLEVQIRTSGGGPSLATPTAGAARAVSMVSGDVGVWLVRYVNSFAGTIPPTFDNTPLTAADFPMLPVKLAAMLQGASGKDVATSAWPTGTLQAYT